MISLRAGKNDASPVRVSTEVLCRGEGKFYVRLRVRSRRPFAHLSVLAHKGNDPCPVQAYPFSVDQAGSDQRWVLILPVVNGAVAVSVWPDDRTDEASSLAFSGTIVKLLNGFNYVVRQDDRKAIRDFERDHVDESCQVYLTERFDAGDGVIWRFYVEWIGDSLQQPEVTLQRMDGTSIECELLPFEFQQGDPQAVYSPNRLYLSAKVAHDCGPFVIVAENPERGSGAVGFAGVDSACDASFAAMTGSRMKSAADDDGAYRRWFAGHCVSSGAFRAQLKRASDADLLISVVVAKSIEPAALKATIESVRAQSYACWELLVPEGLVPGLVASGGDLFDKARRVRSVADDLVSCRAKASQAAAGDYVVFLECGSVLEPDALFEFARAIEEGDAPDVLYCDEDAFAKAGMYGQPVFRTQFDLDAMYSGNWLDGVQVVKRSRISGVASEHDIDPRADAYESMLRAYEQSLTFAHVARVLHHRPISTGLQERRAIEREVLQQHLVRRGIAATVEDAGEERGLRVRYELSQGHPLVSVVIPSKDHVDVLRACVESIVEKSTYGNYEIIVVENNSEDASTFEYYDQLQEKHDCVRVVTWPDEFNYAKIINFGVAQAKGEYLLLLNNDTEVIEPRFIEEMLGLLQRPEVGVVGAKLLFRDGLVQHSGMAVGPFDALVHTNQNFPLSRGGYLNRAIRPCSYTAVTGACQMVRASVFQQLGGYDERFAVGFNDADFCMRAWEAGLHVVMAPDAVLHHFEFTSRGRELADEGKLVRWKREQALFISTWPEPFLKGDPFTNPNLAKDSCYYGLS